MGRIIMMVRTSLGAMSKLTTRIRNPAESLFKSELLLGFFYQLSVNVHVGQIWRGNRFEGDVNLRHIFLRTTRNCAPNKSRGYHFLCYGSHFAWVPAR
jgi:hypothetical protein